MRRGLSRIQQAQRTVKELRSGMCVALGIGLPTLVANCALDQSDVLFLSENGILGVGPSPHEGFEDSDLINAGKQAVTEALGASYFSSDQSFAMIRGGHVDVAVVGALEVDPFGSIASWAIPGKAIRGVGGAMDMLVGAKRVIVLMEHTTRDGKRRLVDACRLPLTALHAASTVITNLAVIEIEQPNGGFVLRELAPGITVEEVQALTGAPLLTKGAVPAIS